MAPAPEAAVGIELTTKDPSEGEGVAWITQDAYEAATPATWHNVPINYFRRTGPNRLLITNENLEHSTLKDFGPAIAGDEYATFQPLDLYVRTDGIYLWFPGHGRGIRIPIATIATYGPDRLPLGAPPQSSAPVEAEALRLDLIPEDEGMDDAGFPPSVLYHIIPAADLSDAVLTESRRDGADFGCSPTLQAVLRALTSCQEHLSTPDGFGEDGEGPQIAMEHDLSVLSTGPGGHGVIGGVRGEDGRDEVRIAGLENFEGWITAENVDEVMGQQGSANGGPLDGELSGDHLGPGAGSRRQRDEADEADDDERVTIWQRTED